MYINKPVQGKYSTLWVKPASIAHSVGGGGGLLAAGCNCLFEPNPLFQIIVEEAHTHCPNCPMGLNLRNSFAAVILYTGFILNKLQISCLIQRNI